MAFPKLSTSQTLSVNRSADLRQSQTPRSGHIVASLLIDIVWIFAAAAIAYGISSAIGLASDLGIGSDLSVKTIQWVSAFSVLASALIFTLQDLLCLFSHQRCLPLEYSSAKASSIYWQRLQITLLTVSFCLILILIGIAFPGMVLVSQLFIAAVFALTILAVRKSIPVAKAGIITSFGIFIATVITIFAMKIMVGSEAKPSSLVYPSAQTERFS
ncbi:MAG: hypothetical protein HC873_12410 [Leptolyngbyaceae cyanobacterium SL_1_1]|nr:hypothetical protein [Leptolyngbyaceae cyanobacterium RM2_2_21]NJN01861.1 hypothetical protein [Leptolyngbyaceae cyanobacterium RM1_1_2]NJO10321.1 hypothetical protein [Leptolyngbyaceae cyanobacterium SL_1_1]